MFDILGGFILFYKLQILNNNPNSNHYHKHNPNNNLNPNPNPSLYPSPYFSPNPNPNINNNHHLYLNLNININFTPNPNLICWLLIVITLEMLSYLATFPTIFKILYNDLKTPGAKANDNFNWKRKNAF